MAIFLQRRKTGEIHVVCSGTIRKKQPLGQVGKKKTDHIGFAVIYDYVINEKTNRKANQYINCSVFGWRALYASHFENGDVVLITGKLKEDNFTPKIGDEIKYYIEVSTIMGQPRSFDLPQKVTKRQKLRKKGYEIETDGMGEEFALAKRDVHKDMDMTTSGDDGDYPF